MEQSEREKLKSKDDTKEEVEKEEGKEEKSEEEKKKDEEKKEKLAKQGCSNPGNFLTTATETSKNSSNEAFVPLITTNAGIYPSDLLKH